MVEGGAQVQQVLNIECLADFDEAPLTNIKFRYWERAVCVSNIDGITFVFNLTIYPF